MELMPGWRERIDAADAARAEAVRAHVPLAPEFFSRGTTYVETAADMRQALRLAQELPVANGSLDFEFQFSASELVFAGGRKRKQDVSAIRPLLASVALAVPEGAASFLLHPFVIDVRVPEVLGPLGELLRLPFPFTGHNLKWEWFCCWRLGLPIPRLSWDSWVCQRALTLGLDRPRRRRGADLAEEVFSKERAKEARAQGLSLVATCRAHGVEHGFSGRKAELQASFLSHPEGAPFSAEDIAYAAEDAIASAKLHPPQVQAAAAGGILNHLVSIEMPWTETSAAMEWEGLLVDRVEAEAVAQACRRDLARAAEELSALGVANPRSRQQKVKLFSGLGLLEHFRGPGGLRFDRDALKANAHLHPAAALLHEHARLSAMLSDGLLDPGLLGSDGRVHPEQHQLAADSGRQATTNPNVLGSSRRLRSVAAARDGHGIGECDLDQVEPTLTGAVFGVPALVSLANGGDLYAGMARAFYEHELSRQDLGLGDREFKARHPERRGRMKVGLLARTYGAKPAGLARSLGTDPAGAQRFVDRFDELFLGLGGATEAFGHLCMVRGCAACATGLKRYRGRGTPPGAEARRQAVNFAIQGLACALFKAAGNRLHRLYPAYGARLLVPLHDSFVFEAPLEQLAAVAELTRRVMCEVIQEHFPELRPRATVEIGDPGHWGMKGKS